jgi:hypothetical protein
MRTNAPELAIGLGEAPTLGLPLDEFCDAQLMKPVEGRADIRLIVTPEHNGYLPGRHPRLSGRSEYRSDGSLKRAQAESVERTNVPIVRGIGPCGFDLPSQREAGMADCSQEAGYGF